MSIANTRERMHKVQPLTVAVTVAAIAIIAVGALTAALISIGSANGAAHRANTIGTCVNGVLGQRQTVSDTPALLEEAEAQVAWSGAVLTLFTLPPHPTPAQQTAAAKAFLSSTRAYASHLAHAKDLLKANAQYRKAHPLGRC